MRPYYYLGNNRGLTQLADGQPFFVDTRDRGITTWILLGGTWETFVDEILCGLTRARDRVLDAGANQGYYTVKLGSLVGPEGQVAAFEPNPEVFDLLASNVDINGFRSRCRLYRQALGAEAGSAELRFSYGSLGSGSLSPHLAGGEECVVVEIASGDDLLPGDTAFDVMKFDVEGFEPQAAEGLQAVLERSPHAAIVVEVSAPAWCAAGDFAEILSRFTVGGKLCFEIGHDGMLSLLELDQPEALAALKARLDPFYMLLVRADHWAIDFVSSKIRRAVQ